MPAQPLTVLAALGIGAWASLTWPERNLGLAVCLTMLAAGLLMWVVARHRRDPWTIACAVLAAALATTTMIRDGGGVVALAVLVGVVVAAAGLTRARTLLSVPLSVVAWPLSGAARPAAAGPHHHRDEQGVQALADPAHRRASPWSPWPSSVACSLRATPCSARGPRRWCPTSAGTRSSRAPSCWPWSPGSPSPAPTSPSTRRRSRASPCRRAAARPTAGSGGCPSASSSPSSPASSSRRPRPCGAGTTTSSAPLA